MDLLNATRSYIELQMLMPEDEPVLVGVSGGVDSMVLLHILLELGHACTVAHVDHGLRGLESDADRIFVEDQCARLGVPFLERRVEVQQHAREHSVSSAMAARELRYRAFREMLDESRMNVLALAHHADDAVETLFIRLLQGMGLRGWRTIPPLTYLDTLMEGEDPPEDLFDRYLERRMIVRPLLHADRASIAAFAARHDIQYREDASNRSTDVLRNRIRHELIPLLEQWRPGARRVLRRNVDLLRDLADVSQDALNDAILNMSERTHDGVERVSWEDILLHASPRTLLQQLLRDIGFHPDRLEDIYRAVLAGATGTRFVGARGTVHLDRGSLLIDRDETEPGSWTIPAADQVPLEAPLLLSLTAPEEIDEVFSPQVAWFDARALRFPLELRPWRPGDRIRPIGLGGSKLISDILIDAKVPSAIKDRMYVLLSEDVIVWLCGMRIAAGYQARPDSKQLLRAEWLLPTGPWSEA